jgi:hypothetical protein
MENINVIIFKGPLFRANKNKSNNYRNAPIKYFTLNKTELNAYTKRNMPWKKHWEPKEGMELVLIDILHIQTRRTLETLLLGQKESLDFSFPIEGNRVSRVSEANATHHDYNVLKAICQLGQFDGYYMKAIPSFHSEVGLCPSGIKKLKLQSVEKALVAPQIGKRTRSNKPAFFSPIQTGYRMNNMTGQLPTFSPMKLFGNINTNNHTRKNKNNNNFALPQIKRSRSPLSKSLAF